MKRSTKHRNILPPREFAKRMFWYTLFAFGLIAFSLLIGTLGYHFIAKLGWIDSIYNSSMILTGMGPVNHLVDVDAKIFASVYALFSGIVFLSTVAIFFSPIAHRLLHVLHVEDEDDDKNKEN